MKEDQVIDTEDEDEELSEEEMILQDFYKENSSALYSTKVSKASLELEKTLNKDQFRLYCKLCKEFCDAKFQAFEDLVRYVLDRHT